MDLLSSRTRTAGFLKNSTQFNHRRSKYLGSTSQLQSTFFSSLRTNRDEVDEKCSKVQDKNARFQPINVMNPNPFLFASTLNADYGGINAHLNEYNHNLMQTRQISSLTDIIPEFAQQYTIWGGSSVILKTFHGQSLPYWACISLTNILVRTSLVPLVIKGAKTSAKFATVAPEIQFLVSSYTRDAKKLKDANAPPSQKLELLMAMWQSLRGIYKLHGVNPLDVLKSPLMQIPVFWYFSVDIRKLINGGNPELAQELTESGFLWVADLTEPDPWYGLPILSGMFLYLNVEVAVGKQSLSGETASKSNIARYLKDGFQSKYFNSV